MLKLLRKIKPARELWLSLATLALLLALIWITVLSLRFLIVSAAKALEDPSARPENVTHFNSDGFKELGL